MKYIHNIKKDEKALNIKRENTSDKNNELEAIRILIENKDKIIKNLKTDFETSITELENCKNFLIDKEKKFKILNLELSDKKQKLNKKNSDFENLRKRVMLIDENIGKIKSLAFLNLHPSKARY